MSTKAADTGGKPSKDGTCLLKLRDTLTCVCGGVEVGEPPAAPVSHLP